MSKNLPLILLILIALISLLATCLFCNLMSQLPDTKHIPREKVIDEYDAISACHWFIKDTLVSPASADFVASEDVKQNGNEWVVQGQVDSQNKFGAMIRSNYLCVMEYQKDTGNWILKNKLIMERE